MSDLPDFLTEGGAAASEPLAPETPVETVQADAVAAPPATDPAPVEPAAPSEASSLQSGHVPLSALLDERERRRAADAELAALRAQAQPPTIPDPYEDPEAFAHHQAVTMAHTAKMHGLQMSRLVATQQHGQEVVDQAMAWAAEHAERDAGFRERTYNSHHPVDLAVAEFKRHQLLNEVGEDPDAYVRRRAAELGFVAPATPQTPAAPQASAIPPKPAAPRPSLAAAPSAGAVAGPIVRTGDDRFNAMFAR